MSTKSDISHEQLRLLSRRLVHETATFFGVARSLTRYSLGFSAAPDWAIETAQVESFALHARALADFLYTKQRNARFPEDAFAIDFFNEASQWTSAVGDEGPWIGRIRRRRVRGLEGVDQFGEQVAHLNYRQAPSAVYARSWPVMQVAAELGEDLLLFSESVPAGRLARGFRAEIKRELPLACRVPPQQRGLAAWTSPASLRQSR